MYECIYTSVVVVVVVVIVFVDISSWKLCSLQSQIVVHEQSSVRHSHNKKKNIRNVLQVNCSQFGTPSQFAIFPPISEKERIMITTESNSEIAMEKMQIDRIGTVCLPLSSRQIC